MFVFVFFFLFKIPIQQISLILHQLDHSDFFEGGIRRAIGVSQYFFSGEGHLLISLIIKCLLLREEVR